MTPEALAALHHRCFTRPRPWGAEEFRALLDAPGSFLLVADHGFLLGRAIAGEAELLTLAVDPDHRRAGTGRALCTDFAATSRKAGAGAAFLEVAADNGPARALYAGLGWREAGRRPRYYGPETDAIVMRLALAGEEQGG